MATAKSKSPKQKAQKKTAVSGKKIPSAKKGTLSKKAVPVKKSPAKKAAAAKKPVPAKKVSSAKKAAASKKPVPAKKAPAKNADVAKKGKKSPPKMKKMVVKPVPVQLHEELFENDSKDFAFAFAASMVENQIAEAEDETKNAEKKLVKLSKRPTSRLRGKDTLKFPASDLAQFRKVLVALRHSIVGKTATLKTNALEQSIDRAGEDEDGSDSFMRLQNLGQVGEQNKTLQKIDEALHRIEDGTYGICEVCGQLIRKARLQHLPFAHTCMECQSEMESKRDLNA